MRVHCSCCDAMHMHPAMHATYGNALCMHGACTAADSSLVAIKTSIPRLASEVVAIGFPIGGDDVRATP